MERSNKPSDFERGWQDAFEGASKTPAPRVWEGIESALDNKKTRRAGWIWWAAASFLLMVAIGGGVFLANNGNEEMVAQEQLKDSDSSASPGQSGLADNTPSANANNPAGSINQQGNNSAAADNQAGSSPTADTGNRYAHTGQTQDPGDLAGVKSDQIVAHTDEPVHSVSVEGHTDIAYTSEDDLSAFAEAEAVSPDDRWLMLDPAGANLWVHDLRPIEVTVYKVPDNAMFAELEDNKEDKMWEADKLWTGLSFAGGSFDPSFEKGAGFTAANDLSFGKNPNGRVEELDVDQEVNPTFSYDMSFNVSGMLGKNFVWQSGLTYQRLNATSNTEMVIQDIPTQNTYPVLLSNFDAYKGQGSKQVAVIATNTETLNSFEFLTVPVKIGYVFGGEKLQFLMSTGVSANIFMANTITSEGGSSFGSYETRAGDENNPFRSLSFNGLVSGEVMYRFAPHFSISAGPMYQYSMGDLAAEGALFSSNPSTFLISTGIKYHIR